MKDGLDIDHRLSPDLFRYLYLDIDVDMALDQMDKAIFLVHSLMSCLARSGLDLDYQPRMIRQFFDYRWNEIP